MNMGGVPFTRLTSFETAEPTNGEQGLPHVGLCDHTVCTAKQRALRIFKLLTNRRKEKTMKGVRSERKAWLLPSRSSSSRGETPNKNRTSCETRDYEKRRTEMPGSPERCGTGSGGPEASPEADTPRASSRDGFSLPSTCRRQCPAGQATMTVVAFVRGRRTRSTRHGEPGSERGSAS